MVVAPGAAETNVAGGAAWGDGAKRPSEISPLTLRGLGRRPRRGIQWGRRRDGDRASM